jgi:6-phosphogluconolactonase (cycloisomerase 2 family)
MHFNQLDAVAIRPGFMRTVSLALTAALLAARAASAASILYATAAATNGVDGFCIRHDGTLAPTPKVHVDTAGTQPRRLLVANHTLYVAELDRIEAFPIGAAGTLRRPTSTRVTDDLDPRDLALAPDGRTLYVTQLGYVSAYALAPDGDVPEEATSCVQGPDAANYLDLQVANGLLYVSADDTPGRIEVYRLAADGSLPQIGCGPATKRDRPDPPIWPDSERTGIQQPKALAVTGDTIYVEERGFQRLIAFRLQPDGTFCDKKRSRTGPPSVFIEDCAGFDQLGTAACARHQARKQGQQCIASSTAEAIQYEGIALHPNGQALLGAQFLKGRVDSYRLRHDARLEDAPRSRLPRRPSVQSDQEPKMTPVRLAIQANTAYVAGGRLDRVVAYHLFPTGVLAERKPSSSTDAQKDTFPNDVAISMLSAACE